MGGSQSSRKLSVDNENAIQVSQEALDRIQSQLNAKQAQQPVPEPVYHPPPQYYESPNRQQLNAAEEAYWNRRIENLKRAHDKLTKGMILDYQKTLKEANDLFEATQKNEKVAKIPPCQDEKSKVLQCYSTNPKQPLICSSLVSEFSDCVCKSRLSTVSAS